MNIKKLFCVLFITVMLLSVPCAYATDDSSNNDSSTESTIVNMNSSNNKDTSVNMNSSNNKGTTVNMNSSNNSSNNKGATVNMNSSNNKSATENENLVKKLGQEYRTYNSLLSYCLMEINRMKNSSLPPISQKTIQILDLINGDLNSLSHKLIYSNPIKCQEILKGIEGKFNLFFISLLKDVLAEEFPFLNTKKSISP